MNEIDRQFAALVAEIQGLSEKELYHRIRANFDQVPYAIQKSCMDFFNQFNYWGRLDPQQGIYEEIEGKGAALFHHIQDFAWLYDHLADYRSKKTLYAILNNWYRYDFITTAQTKESLFDDYFDLDLVTCTPEEVFVDLGAYTGDTIAEFIGYAGEWRRITALEPDPVTFAKLERNTAGLHDCILYRLGAYSRYARLPFAGGAGRGSHLAAGGAMTELDSVDNILCGQTVSLINMDVEGMEAEAIAGMAKTLRRHRPKLLIAGYHRSEDLWRLPLEVLAIQPEYKVYVRHYPCLPAWDVNFYFV